MRMESSCISGYVCVCLFYQLKAENYSKKVRTTIIIYDLLILLKDLGRESSEL